MRLTLRTLLAYLDDTLEPSEIKKIGQKVAESDAAQELIGRLRQVTRRRRLTTPPATGPNSFDPNLVADYLDNELSSEQLAELEKICLESDVHLAEVASCHQILTLVLGEPALVPPTAKERMYALVQGREAIPFRKAVTPGVNHSVPTPADADADEMFLLGLPFYRRASWLRWALPVAGVILLTVVAVALWQSVSSLNQPLQPQQVANGPKPENTEVKPDVKPVVPVPSKPEEVKPVVPAPTHSEGVTRVDPEITTPVAASTTAVTPPPTREVALNTERAEVGSYHSDTKNPPSILVQRKSSDDGWHRLRSGARVASQDRLMSLPGYASELRLDTGVHLLLRGHVREFSLPEFSEMDYLQESAVVLHKTKDLDVDVTLERGRLYLSNHKDKGAAAARLRFEKEVWDLTLAEPGTEVVVDLLKRGQGRMDSSPGAGPLATLFLLVLQGKAELVIEGSHFSNLSRTGPAMFRWENQGPGAGVRGPATVNDKDRAPFAKVLPVATGSKGEAMELALKQLNQRMLLDKAPITALQEELQTEPSMRHNLAIYCLGALDEVKELIKVLGSTDTFQRLDRDTAIITLRRWVGRDAGNGPRLYNPNPDPKDPKAEPTGLLLSLGQEYRPQQAQTIFVLLHNLTSDLESYELLAHALVSDKVAIVELAHWHLARLPLTRKMPDLPNFDATAPQPVRQKLAIAVKRLVESKQPRTTGPSRLPSNKSKKDVPAGPSR